MTPGPFNAQIFTTVKLNKPCFLHRALPILSASLQTPHSSQMYRGRSQDDRTRSGCSTASPPWDRGGTRSLPLSGLQGDAVLPCQAPRPSPPPATHTHVSRLNTTFRLELSTMSLPNVHVWEAEPGGGSSSSPDHLRGRAGR